MTDLREIYDYIQELAPLELAESWDNPGLLVDCKAPVERVLTCLDITHTTVDEAIEKGCGLIVSHHPVIFSPLKSLDADSVPCRMLREGISAICMHTNLDAADGGVNDVLAGLLGMEDVEYLAGGMGRIGNIEEMSTEELAARAACVLGAPVKWADGRQGWKIRRLAIVSGGGGSMMQDAIDAGAAAVLTAEANRPAGHDAIQAGIGLVVAGHFATEFPVAEALARQLEERFPELEVLVSQWDHDPFNNMEP